MRAPLTEISANRAPGAQLSHDARAIAIHDLEDGVKQSVVATRAGCHQGTISKLWQNYKSTGLVDVIPRSGRPSVLTRADERAVIRLVRKWPKMTYKELNDVAGTQCSHDTLYRLLKRHHITNWRAKQRPHLTKVHAQMRLEFAKKHVRWNRKWKKVIFSDETSLERGKGGPRTWCFRYPNEAYDPKMIEPTKANDIRQMFWAAFVYRGRSCLYPMVRDDQSPRKGYSAWSMLQVLEPGLIEIYEPGMTLMQDNAPIHKSKRVTRWLKRNGYRTLKWPPYSPDLNPIEHLWHVLKERVCKRHPELTTMGKSDEDLDVLIETCQEEWGLIRKKLLRKLVKSMPRRMAAVIRAKGWQTKY